MSDSGSPDQVNPFASPPAFDLEPTPLETWADSDASGLRSVRQGLALTYIAICGLTASFLVISVARRLLAPEQAGFVIAAVSAVVVVCFLMSIVGPWLCLSVPADTGARSHVVMSVNFQTAGSLLLVGIAFGLIPVPLLAFWGVPIAGLTSIAFFVLFIRQLARHIRHDDLVRSAGRVLTAGTWFILMCIGLLTLAVFGALDDNADMDMLLAVISFALFAFGLILLVMYANLIGKLTKAITV